MFRTGNEVREQQVGDGDNVYSSEEMREALELCEYQRKMIESLREELRKLEEDIESDD